MTDQLITIDKGKHIYFRLDRLPKDSEKTVVYNVCALKDNFRLGQIKWFSRWRCYAFYPEAETVFEKTCMQDITDFIIKITNNKRSNAS